MTKSDTSKIEDRIQFECSSLSAEVLQSHSVTQYIGYFDAVSDYGGYSRVPPKAAAVCDAIKNTHGQDALEGFNRLALLTLIGQYRQRCERHNYPSEIVLCFDRYFNGIAAQMERNPSDFYLHENDLFSKDFAVCRHKLIPCGAQLIDVLSGVPRSIATSQTGVGGFRFLWFMLSRVGGFKDLYEMHMDHRLILEFNAKGWERCYVRLAKLLECNPEIRGVCGTSWWFDPRLQDISPRLNFLRQIPLSGRANFFKVGTGKASVSNALANSIERQQAHESGAYQPTDWLMVWPTKDLITWAKGREI